MSDQIWKEIQAVFGLDGQPLAPMARLSDDSMAYLRREQLVRPCLQYLQAELEHRLRADVVPSFWKHFRRDSSDHKTCSFETAVEQLYSQVSLLSPFVERMDSLALLGQCPVQAYAQTSYHGLFRLLLKATLLSQLPTDFEKPIHTFYAKALHVFHVRSEKSKAPPEPVDAEDADEEEEEGLDDDDDEDDDDDDDDMPLECSGCRHESEQCQCGVIIASFHDTNRKLMQLDLLQRLTSNVVTQIVHCHIEKHVTDTCRGSFTVSHLKGLENWLDLVVMGWIRLLYSSSPSGISLEDQQVLRTFRQKLCHYFYETYTRVRIDQLFNIVIEFPDSQPALEDLRECLSKTDLRAHFIHSLKHILEQKLLHLGVNTTDILTAYVSAIRALRVLDPSGVLLRLVCEPVCRYLRTRDDTIRCIVQCLIDDSSRELSDELLKTDGVPLDRAGLSELGDADIDAEDIADSWHTWQPDPKDADPWLCSAPGSRGGNSDIISMLVNIYGSKDMFVNEYRAMLSNRLLSQISFNVDTEREIRNLELLKLRFGETSMQQCEVMLKDIQDSKRLRELLQQEDTDNQVLRALHRQPFPVNAVILSDQFWPPFKEQDTLLLPQEVVHSLDGYVKAFESLKKIRTLVWKSHLGSANLDLEIGDKKINFTVSPMHAAVIYQFQEKAEWTAEELAHKLRLRLPLLQRKMAFWLSHGIIRETSPDRYQLVEEGPMRRMSGLNAEAPAGLGEDDDSESVVQNCKDQRAEELQVFWFFIVNMLVNMESLPLDRIYQMLKMFAMQGSSAAVECDVNQLRAFLDEKVRQHELIYSGGNYRLPKN